MQIDTSLRKIGQSSIPRTDIKETFNFLFLFVFLFLNMFVPSSYRLIRMVVLFAWLAYSLFFCNKKIKIGNGLFVSFIIYLVVFSLSFLLGLFKNSEGSLQLFRVYVIFPIVFYLLSLQINSINSIKAINNTLLIIEFLICFTDVWFCIYKLGIVNFYPPFIENIDMGYRFNSEWIPMKFSTTHVCTHIFMVPYTMSLVAYNFFNEQKINIKLLILFAFELLACFFSGRIALWVVCLVSFLIVTIISFHCFKNNRNAFENRILKQRKIFFVVVGLLILLLAIINFYYLFELVFSSISNKLNSSFTVNDSADSSRAIQMTYLINGWLSNFFFGNGMGSHPVYITDSLQPWAYEMTYHYVLYQSGIFGLFALLLFYGAIMVLVMRGYRKKKVSFIHSVPFALGMFSIVLSAAVEPYLFKSGTYWMIFIPFGVAMFSLKKKKEIFIT